MEPPPLQDVAGRVLDNLMDNLDRLYDRLCTPADTVWAPTLLSAAAAIQAYPSRPHGYFETMRDDCWNSHALAVTDELRRALAER